MTLRFSPEKCEAYTYQGQLFATEQEAMGAVRDAFIKDAAKRLVDPDEDDAEAISTGVERVFELLLLDAEVLFDDVIEALDKARSKREEEARVNRLSKA